MGLVGGFGVRRCISAYGTQLREPGRSPPKLLPEKQAAPHPRRWDPAGMGHHSYLVVGEYQFFYTRDHYNEELAALFNESDRELVVADAGDDTRDDEWDGKELTFGYYTTANALRQRLNVQGFTSHRALADLAEGVERWRKTYADQSDLREREARGEQLYQTLARPPREPAELLAAMGEAIGPHRPQTSFATGQKYVSYLIELTATAEDVEELRWFVEGRSLVRLILDQAPTTRGSGWT
ncbi:HEPN/Toprim-associated domain-containing protein [Streptomyces sp. NPDC047082]|uniref:HEPN/Toprim-associated domain-containing protein n=1 Tax=Streptomyces sp. NPDC047082 TaxID=3155259 RepID=UPI0033F3354F